MRLLRFCSASLLLLSGAIFISCNEMQNQGVAPNITPSPGASTQLLYAIGNGAVSTYAVDKNALTFASLGQPVNLIPTGSLVQFVPGPNDDFLYVLWSDAGNLQHLSVYATDTSGIPRTPAVQTVDAPSLYQFNIHRSAHFVYMMQVSDVGAGYISTVRLFYVNAADGKLHEDPTLQGSYGPYDVWPASLYGLSADGNKIYLSRQTLAGPFYEQRSLNIESGTLGPNVVLYQPAGGTLNSDVLVIGARVMIDEYRVPGTRGYIDVFPLIPRPRRHLFRCTAAVLLLARLRPMFRSIRRANISF